MSNKNSITPETTKDGDISLENKFMKHHTQDATRNEDDIMYHKEAISHYRKIDYLKGLNGHTDFTSANTLRNSVKNAINLDGQFDRFKPSL